MQVIHFDTLGTGRYSRRGFLARLGLTAAAVPLLAACGQRAVTVATASSSGAAATTITTAAAPNSRAATSHATSAVATAAPGGKTVQLVATNWASVTIAALFNKVLQQFQQAHPSIKVAFSPTTNYWTKLPAQAAAGTPPDAFWMNAQNLGLWAARKQLLNLSPLVARDKFDFTDFWKAGVAAYTLNGTLLSLPGQVDNRGLFFNQTLFAAAGVAAPPTTYQDKQWDWQAFLTASQHTTKAAAGGSPSQFGFVVPTGFIDYAPWVWAAGGHFMNADRTSSAMASSQTVAAFQFLQDLIHKYQVAPGPDVLKTTAAPALFGGNRVAMSTDTISMITNYRKTSTGFTWDTGAIPAGAAGFANQSSGPAWSIEQQTKHADEAWLLDTFLVSAEVERTLAQSGAQLPSRVSIAKEVWGKPTDAPAHANVFLDGMNYVHPNPFVWNWGDIESMLTKQLAPLWAGSHTAHDVMLTIEPLMNQLLALKPSI